MYHVSMTLASIKSKKEGLGMIFYFGSTGNSKYCAEKIAAATNDRIISIADALKDEEHIYHLAPQEQLGFVFPTYFMDVPQIVMEFIKKIEIQGYESQYVFSIITCNNVPGYIGERIHDILLGKGFKYSWSLFDYYARKLCNCLLHAKPRKRKQNSHQSRGAAFQIN